MSKSRSVFLLFGVLIFFGCAHPGNPNSAETSEMDRSFYLMGTSLNVSIVSASREKGSEASEEVFRAVQAAEKRLSTWTSESELARVNQTHSGTEMILSEKLNRDLRNAYQCAERTAFAFSPWVGPLVQVWETRTGGRIPKVQARLRATRASQDDAFRWTERGLVKQNPDAIIEEGGFGKGVGLDDAMAQLRPMNLRKAVLNFGGQISILGDARVAVEISDPRQREQTLLKFEAGEGSISTSGNSEHGSRVKTSTGFKKIGHILDAHSGRPSSYEGSVTVVAPTGIEADCLSTALFVMGSERAMQWLKRNSIQAVWITPGKNPGKWIARASCAWKPPLEKTSDSIEIQKDCEMKEGSHGES